jgi:hypothetical protein
MKLKMAIHRLAFRIYHSDIGSFLSPFSGHFVALQVAFERQILKPVFHLIGYRLWV